MNENIKVQEMAEWKTKYEPMSFTVKTHELDPNGLSAHSPGAKLDSGKVMADLLQGFSRALMAVGEVATFGANKYTRDGWKTVDNGFNRYSAAMMRHWFKEPIEDADKDSGLLHEAHLAWNALARLEFKLKEMEESNEDV